jgi:hypothetical protein
MSEDVVNHPSHYADGSIECIDAMESMMAGSDLPDHDAYLWGNVFKYIWRWHKKAGVQDLKKARWYLDRLIENREVEE